MEKLKNTKILGVIGNILVIISLFCTWVTVESVSTGLTESNQFISGKDGALALALSCISLVIIFAENISPSFFKGLTNIKITFIPSVVQLLMIVNVIYNMTTLPVYDDVKWNFGIGFYLMCIGVVLLLIFPCIYKQDKKE